MGFRRAHDRSSTRFTIQIYEFRAQRLRPEWVSPRERRAGLGLFRVEKKLLILENTAET
jgi:hypothetical protein